jgi:DNA-binding CsgD family transcriptional regulator
VESLIDQAISPALRSVPSLPLTARQMEVLRLLAQGIAPIGIAETLGVSLHTVRNHIQGIARRLRAHSRVEMVSKAYRAGLI